MVYEKPMLDTMRDLMFTNDIEKPRLVWKALREQYGNKVVNSAKEWLKDNEGHRV